MQMRLPPVKPFERIRQHLSKSVLYVILFSMLVVSGYNQRWKQGVIKWDIIRYYSYLPATFIYHDLHLTFAESDPFFKDKLWITKTPEQQNIIKMSSGMAILYAPFFFAAHGIALLFPDCFPPDGYSPVYSFFLLLSDILYTWLGLVFLRKILRRLSFRDWIIAGTLLCLYFGTNLFWYSLYEVMPHAYLFALIAVFIYYTMCWHEQPAWIYLCTLGLVLGLIVLIRPVNSLIVLLFVLYQVNTLDTLNQKIRLLWAHKGQMLVFAGLVCAVFFIQMLYWKYSTGHWLYWSYVDEGFFFLHPHIGKGLFGFRKGWYIYTPLMLLATIGLVAVKKYAREFYTAQLLFFCVFIYVTFSWWCWWYGGSLSCRPVVDIYAVMGIGLASFVSFVYDYGKVWIRWMMYTLIALCSLYGFFYNVQYHYEVLHWESMTYESWKIGFGQLHMTEEYRRSFKDPDAAGSKTRGEESE